MYLTKISKAFTIGLTISAALVAQAQPLPDVTKGSAAQCMSCHSFDKAGIHSVGPNLFGVIGRPIAGAPGFVFSTSLRNVGGIWTEVEMDKWLQDPQSYAPGTKMAYAGIKDEAQRKEIIDVLKALK